jgi:EamA-like transporter family
VPVFAVAVGLLVLGESVTWYQPLGALIVLAGVAVSHGPRKPAPDEAEPEPVVAPDCSSPRDGQVDEEAARA